MNWVGAGYLSHFLEHIDSLLVWGQEKTEIYVIY